MRCGLGMAVAVLCGGVALAAPPPALYTAQQAAAGAGLFSHDCAMCHGADMKGGAGPALVGQGFAAAGSTTSLGGVFSVIAQQMPANAPGSLTQAQDEDAMAYILKQNGYPAGSTPLNYKDSMASTTPLVSQVK